ncbi:MAG: LPXTG cell wall anchor domain-containing protein [Ignavibacteria bacterium]|nr:LPXTG cell wall anchor domain-containing protein [Ignavibacteria bacterium]
MRSRLYSFVFALALSLGICGCLNYHQEVNLLTDGSGTMKLHYWMKIIPTDEGNMSEKLGLFNKDSVRREFTSKFIKLKDVKVYTDTTDSTCHSYVEFAFDCIDSLNKTKPFTDAAFSMQDGASGQKIFTQFIPPVMSGFGLDTNKYTVEYVYNFPGEIITHNATSVNNKTLSWKYKIEELGKGKTISVTFRPYKLKETPVWILVLAGLVLVIVIVFLFRKRRN